MKYINIEKNISKKFGEKIKDIHNNITNCGYQNEKIEIKYITSGKNKEEFLEQLKTERKEDVKKGYTQTGIHRDDIEIYIDDKKVSVFGSQGQQRTAILSLKLTELNIIYEETGERPILLLDDFMSELDENRIKKLLETIKENQVIITCTDKIEVENNKKYFYIEKGQLKKEGN